MRRKSHKQDGVLIMILCRIWLWENIIGLNSVCALEFCMARGAERKFPIS